MEDLVEYCRNRSIDEILALADVSERLTRYYEQTELFRAMLRQRAQQRGNVIAIDLREQEEIYAGNRFAVYTLFPDANVSVQMMWGFQKQNIVIACGHSVTNRTCQTNIGQLMLEWDGGGHRQVGTCQVPVEKADEIFEEICARLQAVG